MRQVDTRTKDEVCNSKTPAKENREYTKLSILQTSQPAKLQKKQCGGVYFGLYGITY